MTEAEKWAWIQDLEDKYLKGGIMLSEWSTMLAKEADHAFCSGANLAAVLAAQAAMEAHLRYDFFDPENVKGWGFYKLIEGADDVSEDLRERMHEVRRFRNTWVHVNDPHDDEHLLERPELVEAEAEVITMKALDAMMDLFCTYQWV
ncbi:MAG: hypothetical protein ACOY3Y_07815 [Acidobacteriota bacterium]